VESGAVAIGDGVSSLAGYERPFGLRELETVSGVGSLRFGRVGVGVSYQGSQVAESESAVTAGIRVKEVGVGVRVRQVQYADRRWPVFDLGLLIVGRNGIPVGLVGRNTGGSQTGILGHGGMVGMSVTRDRMTFAIDVQKEAGTPTGGAVGLEIRVSAIAAIRAGVGGYPERLTLGLGVRCGLAEIDYGILYHTVLGFSHRVAISLTK